MKFIDLKNGLPWHKGGRYWRSREPDRVDRIIVHQGLQDASVQAINKYHITPANMNMTPFEIKAFRTNLRHTQDSFGKLLGVDGDLVKKWELGYERPEGEPLHRLGRLQNHISLGGCPHICYHVYIPGRYSNFADDEILICNDFTDSVWHAGIENDRSIGIMLEGDLKGPGHPEGHEPLPTQLSRLDYTLKYFRQLKKYLIFGHCHFGKPACPGYGAMEVLARFHN